MNTIYSSIKLLQFEEQQFQKENFNELVIELKRKAGKKINRAEIINTKSKELYKYKDNYNILAKENDISIKQSKIKVANIKVLHNEYQVLKKRLVEIKKVDEEKTIKLRYLLEK